MEEIDFFETYCTVAKLTKVCMMFIFKTLINMKLKSKQSDVTITFLHSTLKMRQTVFKSFLVSSSNFQQRLQSSLSQQNSLWFASKSLCLLKHGNCGLLQICFGSYRIISNKIIVICYVDNLLFWIRNEEDFVDLVIQWCAEAIDS
ncbi:LOW QUALITY PROTEIN: hypothetical protein ACHAXS_004452 [Conticribra weissflogii]